MPAKKHPMMSKKEHEKSEKSLPPWMKDKMEEKEKGKGKGKSKGKK